MKTLFNHKIILAMAATTILATATSSAQEKALHLQPEKRVYVKKSLDNFSSIEATSIFQIQVSQSDKQSVTIDAPENYMPFFSLEVKNGTLKISMKDTVDVNFEELMCRVIISVKNLEKIKLSGASSLSCEGTIKAENFSCKLSGASSANLALNTSSLSCFLTGASALNIAGNVNGIADMDVSGASVVYGYKLKAKSADCYVSGASKAELYADESLRIEASGVSQVNYKGNAKVLAMATGMSSVSGAK